MTPYQVDTLRRIANNDLDTVSLALSGALVDSEAQDGGCAALLRLTATLCVDSSFHAIPWEIDEAIAAGVTDDDIFQALMIVAPIVGMARLSAALPHLVMALDLEGP